MSEGPKFTAAALAASQTAWCLLVAELSESKSIDLARLDSRLRLVQKGLLLEGQPNIAEAFVRYLDSTGALLDESYQSSTQSRGQ